MELRYRFPQGVMTIQADVFFLKAGRRKIRKMLADYKKSDPEKSRADELRAWLIERIDETEEKLRFLSSRIQEEQKNLESCELRYEYWRTYCDDKDKLKNAKEDLKIHRMGLRELSSDLSKAKAALKAYRKSLEDVENLLDFEEGPE